jgi:hypothetical protein
MSAVKRLVRILTALLREIGDEAAYQRYLARGARAPSRQEWLRFCELRFRARYTRPKCC